MSKNLKKLLDKLSTHSDFQKSYLKSPDDIMDEHKLTSDEKMMMKNQDVEGIRKAIGEEESPIPINGIIYKTNHK